MKKNVHLKMLILILLLCLMHTVVLADQIENAELQEQTDPTEKTLLEEVKDAVKENGQVIVDAVKDGGEMLVNSIQKGFERQDQIADATTNAITGAIGDMGEAFGNLINGSGRSNDGNSNPYYDPGSGSYYVTFKVTYYELSGKYKYSYVYYVTGDLTGSVNDDGMAFQGKNCDITIAHDHVEDKYDYTKHDVGSFSCGVQFRFMHGPVQNGSQWEKISISDFSTNVPFWLADDGTSMPLTNEAYECIGDGYTGLGSPGVPKRDSNGSYVYDEQGNIILDVPSFTPEQDTQNPQSPLYIDPNPYNRGDKDIDGVIPWLKRIAELIKWLPTQINTTTQNNVTSLFVPEDIKNDDGSTTNYFQFEFNSLHNDFSSKMPVIDQVGSLYNDMTTGFSDAETSEAPDVSMNLGSISLMGEESQPLEFNILDFSFMNEEARAIMHGVILLIAWLRFIVALPKKIQRLIRG